MKPSLLKSVAALATMLASSAVPLLANADATCVTGGDGRAACGFACRVGGDGHTVCTHYR